MSREWAPGDVAMHPQWGISGVSGRCERHFASGLHWHHLSGGWDHIDDALSIGKYRPLVVIDPEDREQVERLLDSLQSWSLDGLQAALREFANPTPPKPDEPTGLGAVVEDAEGRRWVRIETHEAGCNDWQVYDERVSGLKDKRTEYADIAAVRTLSKGAPS